MSLYGSQTKLPISGMSRSTSRPELSNYRNDVFVGGNGFQGDYQAGDGGFAYTNTTNFTRHSVHGGGFGGQNMQVSMGAGGGAIR